MMTFSFAIVTPEKAVFQGDADLVELHSTVGALGVMAAHLPLLADCPAGTIKIRKNGHWIAYHCDAGIFSTDGREAKYLTAFAEADAQTP